MLPSLKAAFRDRLKSDLLDLQKIRAANVEAQAIVELDQQAVGRLSRMDAMQQQAMAKASEANRRRSIAQIEAALLRIEEDEFGYCLECGEDIAPKRLELSPTVLTCITCANG